MKRYITLFENFHHPKKDYGRSITTEDFANLKAGDSVKYLGSKHTVIEPGEYVITIKNDETGHERTVNLGQFNQNGWID